MGWEVNLLFYFMEAASILANDIDGQLKTKYLSRFEQSKKKMIVDAADCAKKARYWTQRLEEKLQELDIDGMTYASTNNHSTRYSNFIANANSFIRFNMLFVDRAHADGADGKIFKFLRRMPENGIFPTEFMERFRMKIEVTPEVGDEVLTTHHGKGVLLLHVGNKNWNVRTPEGEIILNETQFKLL